MQLTRRVSSTLSRHWSNKKRPEGRDTRAVMPPPRPQGSEGFSSGTGGVKAIPFPLCQNHLPTLADRFASVWCKHPFFHKKSNLWPLHQSHSTDLRHSIPWAELYLLKYYYSFWLQKLGSETSGLLSQWSAVLVSFSKSSKCAKEIPVQAQIFFFFLIYWSQILGLPA